MEKTICIITKSKKRGGYCVAGFDVSNNQWIRLVSSLDPYYDKISVEFMNVDGYDIQCFDVVNFDFLSYLPNGCQTENWLINKEYKPKLVKKYSLEEILKLIQVDNDDYVIANTLDFLVENEIKNLNRSLYLYEVNNLKIQEYSHDGDSKKSKFKCSFNYKNINYTNVSLTDIDFLNPKCNGMTLNSALVVTSIPCIPFENGRYYKFIAKIIPIQNSNSDSFIKIMKEGSFYGVKNNDALLINKYFGYKLFGKNIIRAGFHASNLENVLKKLDELCIDYDVYHYSTEPTISKRFENNNYHYIAEPEQINNKTQTIYYSMRRSELLNYLANGINAITGEKTDIIDEKLKFALLDCAKMIEKKEGNDNGFKLKVIEEE